MLLAAILLVVTAVSARAVFTARRECHGASFYNPRHSSTPVDTQEAQRRADWLMRGHIQQIGASTPTHRPGRIVTESIIAKILSGIPPS